MITGDEPRNAADIGRGDVGGQEFDVFLSHNAHDKPVVERIAEQLRREGLRPFLDVWDLTPGGRWQRELFEGLSRSRTCALFVGPHAYGQWQLEELEIALVQANKREDFRVFPVLLPGIEDPFDPQRLPPFVSTRTWVDLRNGTNHRQALQRLLNAIAGVAPGPATPVEPVGGVVPYRGLETFEEEHAELFFGRERDIQRLLEILKTSPLLCVVGPSGCGKSSLVRAGLIPRLRAGALPGVEDCEVCVLRPGAHPLRALATQLAPLGTGEAMQATLDDLASDRRTLQLAVSLALGADSPDRRVVIVVDQLEEVFTLCSDEHEREQFFANLLHAAFAGGGQTIVVLTMRADFYGRCAAYPELAQRTIHGALIGSMDTDELRQAIEQPARKAGLFFEPGLVQTILDDVGTDSGALPLLEHALLEVWRRRVGDQLTLDGYVQAGRVEGALAQRAESVYSSFTAAQQQLARRLLLRLTQPGEGSEDTRRRAALHELATTQTNGTASFNEVLGCLVDARLLTTGRDETGDQVIDVSHEALIRGWPRLQGWIDADRAGLLIHRRLTDAAREWDTLDREPAALYRGARLAAAREWATDHPDDLSTLERDFVNASAESERNELEAAKQRTRRLRALATVLAALSVIVAALALWALDQRNDANTAKARARTDAARANAQARLATSRQLAAQASSMIDGQLDRSLLLSLAALKVAHTAEAEGTLLAALQSSPTAMKKLTTTLPTSGWPVNAVGVSPDGRLVLAATADGTVRAWSGRRLAFVLTGPSGGATTSIALSPDGRSLATGAKDATIRIWDVGGGRLVSRFRGHTAAVTGVAITPDGRQIISGSLDNTVRYWDARTARQVGLPLRLGGAVAQFAVSPNGRLMASADDQANVRLFFNGSRRPRGSDATLRQRLRKLIFSPDGRTLTAITRQGKAIVWRTARFRRVGRPLVVSDGPVSSVAPSPDGRRLAIGTPDGSIALWSYQSRWQLGGPAKLHRTNVTDQAFTRDGRHVVSGSTDGSVVLWDVTLKSWARQACAIAERNLTLAEWQQFIRNALPYARLCPRRNTG